METPRIGPPIDEVETPALVVDLDVLESNLKRAARYAEERGLVNIIGDLVGNDTNKQQQLYQLAESKIAEAAAQSELADRAEKNTRAMLESMLHQLGYERVTITFVKS